MKDPVYGCVGAISVLQRQVVRLQKELDATNADLLRFAGNEMHNPMLDFSYGRRLGHAGGGGGGSFGHSGFSLPYNSPWNINPSGDGTKEGGDGNM
ncbi:hypothetical protein U1Q18_012495 [Sarracenia purpurea var. burkii]